MVSEGVLKTCLAQIRRVLGETAQAPQYIATVHRRGYRFMASVTVQELPAPTPEAAVEPFMDSRTVRTPLALLVARQAEMAQLHQWWTQALQGTRQVVFITGEAGIGKTSLVDAFVAQVATSETVWFCRGQCIEQYGAGEAYFPLLEAFGQLGRGRDGARLVELLRQQAPSWLLQMPALLPATAYEALQQHSSGTTRDRMLRELAEAVETLTLEHPLALVVEDLHWSDLATLDWLAFVARRRATARLLVLGTYRPADAVMRAHPVHTVVQELQLSPVLYSLYELYEYRGAFERSRELGEQLLHVASRHHDPVLLLGAYDALACTAFHLGTFAQVLEHTERGLSLYDPQQHRTLASLYGKNLGVTCWYWSAMALWFLGYPDQALGRIDQALTLA
jgi:tetratricopeptide (TPR) repeat protein